MWRTVLADANVIISYMLALGTRRSIILPVIEAGLEGDYRLVIGEMTLLEAESAYRRKGYLRMTVSPSQFASTISLLRSGAEILPPAEPILPVCRDPRDDYLIALALTNAATHLLTGDRDLLALDDGRFPFRVLDATELARELGIPVP